GAGDPAAPVGDVGAAHPAPLDGDLDLSGGGVGGGAVDDAQVVGAVDLQGAHGRAFRSGRSGGASPWGGSGRAGGAAEGLHGKHVGLHRLGRDGGVAGQDRVDDPQVIGVLRADHVVQIPLGPHLL